MAKNKDINISPSKGISIDWLALVDGYCYVGRQRSWTWIKLDSARSVVLEAPAPPTLQ